MNPIRPHEKIIKSRGATPGNLTGDDDTIFPDKGSNREILRSALLQREESKKPKEPTDPKKGRLDTDGLYRAMATEDGFGCMGFYTVRDNGNVDLFSYASLGDVELTKGEHGEYLSFVHRTKAVTLSGKNLFDIIDAMNRHTLSTLYEYGKDETGRPLGYRNSQPLITDVLITDVTEKQNAKRIH